MQEWELKLELTAAENDVLAGALGRPDTAWLQDNTYLDTPGGTLRNARTGLRLRAEWTLLPEEATPALLESIGFESDPQGVAAPCWILTLKGSSTTSGALYARSEKELSVPDGVARSILAKGLDPARLDWPPLTGLQVEAPGSVYRALGSIRTLRRRFPSPVAADPGAVWLDLDVSLYPDRSRGFELEVELASGLQTQLSEAAHSIEPPVREFLVGLGIPWRPAREGKFSRFLKRRGQTS